MRAFMRLAAAAVLTSAGSDAIFSNVKVSNFDQSGLELSFRVSWDTDSVEDPADSDPISVWLLTRQPNPSSWIETILEESIENTGSVWINAGDSWAERGSWDETLSGEASVCIYNTTDFFDNACAEGLGIFPSSEAPSASAGDGISSVSVPRIKQNGSLLSFSVTWADGGGAEGPEDTAKLVDIWLTAKQYDPQAWVELPLQQNAGNTRLAHLDVEMDWSLMGWDLNVDGELSICIYDTQDYQNNDCSDFEPFEGSLSAGLLGDKVGVGSEGGSSSGDSHSTGTMVAFLAAGGLVVGLAVWLMVGSSRRRQRRRLLGSAHEAEALPEDAFIRTSNPYTQF